MKNLLFIISFLATASCGFCAKAITVKDTKDVKLSFHHHNAEFHLTPSADYALYQKGTDYKANNPYEFRMPFIGFDIGAQYMYRPCELFGVSTGLGFRMQGSYYRHTAYFLGNKYVDAVSNAHTGFLQLPIEAHLFKKMEHSTFEFATGPQFNFPLFSRWMATDFLPNGDKASSDKQMTKYTNSQIKDGASLGWNILLGAELELCEYSDMFIGPQINFLNLVAFDKTARNNQKMYGRYVDCSLGLKLGFRFHCLH